MRIGFATQDHAEGGSRFVPCQGAGPAGASAEGGDKAGKLGFQWIGS